MVCMCCVYIKKDIKESVLVVFIWCPFGHNTSRNDLWISINNGTSFFSGGHFACLWISRASKHAVQKWHFYHNGYAFALESSKTHLSIILVITFAVSASIYSTHLLFDDVECRERPEARKPQNLHNISFSDHIWHPENYKPAFLLRKKDYTKRIYF